MQIEAIYSQGKLEFTKPISLRHKRIKVMVDVPDEEINDNYNLPPEIIAMAQEMEQKTDAILAAPFQADEEIPELTEKQLDRIEAFKLREDR